MAYVEKTRIEQIASNLLELRWSEMMQIAQWMSLIELSDNTSTTTFWASQLHDWAEEHQQPPQVKS